MKKTAASLFAGAALLIAWPHESPGQGVAAGNAVGCPADPRVRDAERRCANGDWPACVEAGSAYSDCGTAGAYTRAAELLALGCDHNLAFGCRLLGGLYTSGVGVGTPDSARDVFRRAGGILERGCDAGEAAACNDLGEMVEARQVTDPRGRSALQLFARAVALYEEACGRGEALACRHLAELHVARGDDTGRSRIAYARACDAGDASSCCAMGVFHLRGEKGAERDPQVATGFFERACLGGDLDCCSWAGEQYETGDPQGLDRAAMLFEKGCEGGKPFSCYRLAKILESSAGKLHDSARAASLYRKACAAGVREACNR